MFVQPAVRAFCRPTDRLAARRSHRLMKDETAARAAATPAQKVRFDTPLVADPFTSQDSNPGKWL